MFNNSDYQHRLRYLCGRLRNLEYTPRCVRNFSYINNGHLTSEPKSASKRSYLLQVQIYKDQLIEELMQLANSQAYKIKNLYEEIKQIKDEHELVRLNFFYLEKAHCQLLANRLGDRPKRYSDTEYYVPPAERQEKPIYHGNIVGIFKFPSLQLYYQLLEDKQSEIENITMYEFDKFRNGLDRLDRPPEVPLNLEAELGNIQKLMSSMTAAMDELNQLVESSRKYENEARNRCKLLEKYLNTSIEYNKTVHAENSHLTDLLNESRHKYENEIQLLKIYIGRLMFERDQMRGAAAFYFMQSEGAIKTEPTTPPKKTPNILFRR